MPADSQSRQDGCALPPYNSYSENKLFLGKDGFTSPVITKKNCQLFISVFLIVVKMWPKTLTQNFSKSGLRKARAFINVYPTFPYAAALVKACFYLILKILLLMGKPAHKLGKCSITSLTEIDLGAAVGHYRQVKAAVTPPPAHARHRRGDRGTSAHYGGRDAWQHSHVALALAASSRGSDPLALQLHVIE